MAVIACDLHWKWVDRESMLKKPFVFSEGSGPQLQISTLNPSLLRLLISKEHSPEEMILLVIKEVLW